MGNATVIVANLSLVCMANTTGIVRLTQVRESPFHPHLTANQGAVHGCGIAVSIAREVDPSPAFID